MPDLLVAALILLVAIVVAVLVRLLRARRGDGAMPEGILLDVSTWLIVLITAVTLGSIYVATSADTRDRLGELASGDGSKNPPATGTSSTSSTDEPTDTGTTETPTTLETTPTTATTPVPEPPVSTTPAPVDSQFANCDAEKALTVSVPGFQLTAASAPDIQRLQKRYSKVAQLASRKIQLNGEQVAELVAVCPTLNLQGTRKAVLGILRSQLATATGEAIQPATLTLGRTVVNAHRSSASDQYAGVWNGRQVVYFVQDTTTPEVEPFLRAGVPRMRR